MSKDEFTYRCIQEFKLLVINHTDGKLEVMDASGKSNYSKVYDYTGDDWLSRYNTLAAELAFAREQQ